MGAPTEVADIADGNINRVVRITCQRGSVVVKQGLPFVRVDPSWQLSPTRTVHEARAYLTWNRFAPGVAPGVYALDEAGYVLAMEDLGELRSWRLELLEGRLHPASADAIGAFVARIAFHTSSLGLASPERRGAAGDGSNPAMTALMDDVAFLEPYVEHAHNRFPDGARAAIREVREDAPLQLGISRMRARYLTHAEALIHGDLHTGSVMVGASGTRLIDAEFCRYGPVAWDVGQLMGNFLIAQARMLVLADVPAADGVAALPVQLWRAFEAELRRLWPERWAGIPDEFLEGWLHAIARDAVRFAGCEMIRQVIGSGRVEDIETLPDAQRVAVCVALLRSGRHLVLDGALEVGTVADVVRADAG